MSADTPTPLDLDGDGSPFTPDDVELCHARTITMHANPAPAWDEEATRVALVDAQLASVRQVMEDGYPSIFVRSNEDAADAALAVVREHLS